MSNSGEQTKVTMVDVVYDVTDEVCEAQRADTVVSVTPEQIVGEEVRKSALCNLPALDDPRTPKEPEVFIHVPTEKIESIQRFRNYLTSLYNKNFISERSKEIAIKLQKQIAEGVTEIDDLVRAFSFSLNADVIFAVIRYNEAISLGDTRLVLDYELTKDDLKEHVGIFLGILTDLSG